MTAAYGHGVTAAILGLTLDRALLSWWKTRGPGLGSEVAMEMEAEDVSAGWYRRMLCTHKPTSRLYPEWLPR